MGAPQLDARLRLLAQDESARVLAEMARNIRTVANELGRVGETSRTNMRRAKESTDEFARSISDLALGSLGAVATVAGAAETIRQSVTKFADVQSIMGRIGREGGMTKQNIKELREEFVALGHDTLFSFDQISKAYRDFQGNTSLTGKEAEEAFADITRAANVAGVEIGTMARAYNAGMGSMKVAREDMKEVLDAWIEQLPGSVEDFAQSAPKAAAELARFGLTGKQNAIELAAVFNQLTTTMGSARNAGQSFQAIIGTIGQQPLLTGVFYEAVKAGGTLADGLEKVISELERLGALDASERGLRIAEKLGISPDSQRALAAVRDNLKSIRDNALEGADAVGEIARRQRDMGEEAAQKIQHLKSGWDELLTTIGEATFDLGGGGFMKDFGLALDDLRRRINDVREAINLLIQGDFSGAFGKLGEFAQGATNPRSWLFGKMPQYMNPFTGPPAAGGAAIDYLRQRWRGGSGTETEFDRRFRGEDAGRNQEENTKALKTLTDELRKRAGDGSGQYTPTSYGSVGGPQGGATPRGLRSGGGYSLQHQDFGGASGGPTGGGDSVGGQVPRALHGAPGGGRVGGGGGAVGGADVGAGSGGVGGGRGTVGGGDGGGGVGGDVGGANSLAEQRAPLMAEVERDPETKQLLYQMMATEGGGSATVEALFNRTAMIRQKVPGYSIKNELRSGFYGPINIGKAQRTAVSPAMRSRYDRDLARVMGGSNIIQGRTDQGTYGDPNANGPGRVSYPGMSRSEIYNFWKGSRRGHQFTYKDTAAWAERQNALANAPTAGGLNQPALTQRPDMPTEAPPELRAPEAPSFDERFGAAFRGRQSSLDDYQRMRGDLERPIKMAVEAPQMPSQLVPRFRRASARDSLNREVRDARWLSYSDIGAA